MKCIQLVRLTILVTFGCGSLGFFTQASAQDKAAPDRAAGLSTPLAQGSNDPTLEKAELNYRARRLTTAMEQFGMIAALQDHPFAWLRIGNICHRRGDVTGAFDAYRRAQAAASGSARFSELRGRAVMNLALLGLDQAQLALEEMSLPDRAKASDIWVTEVKTRIGELTAAIPRASPMTESQTAPNESLNDSILGSAQQLSELNGLGSLRQ